MSDERVKILMFQYFLFRGDVYRDNAKKATIKLQRSKCLSSSEYQAIYRDLLLNELFDKITEDVFMLLR